MPTNNTKTTPVFWPAVWASIFTIGTVGVPAMMIASAFRLGPGVGLLITVVGAVILAPNAIRCSRALARRGKRHDPLIVNLLAILPISLFCWPELTVGWMGDWQRIAGLAIVVVGSATTLAFAASGAQVDAVDQDRDVPFTGLDVFSSLGGGLGIAVARVALSAHGERYRLPSGVPYHAAILGILVAVVFPRIFSGEWFFTSAWVQITGLPWPR